MKIEVYIDGRDFLHKGRSFNDSILKLLKETTIYKLPEELSIGKAQEIEIIKKICQNDSLMHSIEKHITLDTEFANKVIMQDTINCSCLKAITSVGDVLKELMIDNYQLVLTNRTWVEVDHLVLFFEAVNYGEANRFVKKSIRGIYT
ncbi:hypothetical protein [Flavobacterium hiemivividum]|uniref:Uncharacterized protein n=1 Tax=Flavobacterium hiemivividum TaxID=2541734 RepID=A0A4R5D2J8_9FLAO|nr:hypothetical protein [Flavobacterium hiemivividum]TDE05314.1 hypothetical protein E0F98_04155 [Flavobacterium hiemivividum]